MVGWARGDPDAGRRNLDRAIAISRRPGHAQLRAAQLFNRGMILHDAGRDTEARLQLRESLRLREAMPGDHAGLAGDTLRLLGETSAGLGEHATAERQLRSEEHTSELQSLMRISYAVFCLKKKQQ